MSLTEKKILHQDFNSYHSSEGTEIKYGNSSKEIPRSFLDDDSYLEGGIEDINGYYDYSRKTVNFNKSNGLEEIKSFGHTYNSEINSNDQAEVEFITDTNGNLTYISPNLELSLGYSLNESLSNNLLQLIHIDDHSKFVNNFNTLVKGENKNFIEKIQFVSKSGSLFDYGVSVEAIYDNQEVFTGTKGRLKSVFSDNQDSNSEEIQNIRIQLFTIKNLILITDNDANIIDYNISRNNPALLNPDLFVNKRITDIFPDNVAKDFINFIQYLQNCKELITYNYQLESESNIRYFAVTISKIEEKRFVLNIQSIEDPFETENLLRNINSLQTLINNISSDLIRSNTSNFKKIMNLSLTQLGIFSQVDSVRINLFDGEKKNYNSIYQWNALGISPDYEIVSLNTEDYISLAEHIRNFGYIYLPSSDIIVSKIHQDSTEPNQMRMKSLLAVSLHLNGEFLGFMSFCSFKTHKYWDEEIINILKEAGAIFAGSINRIDFELKLINEKNLSDKCNKAKSNFVTDVCKELLKPMNSILRLSEEFIETNLDNNNLRKSSQLYNNANRVVDLINDICKISEIDSDNFVTEDNIVNIKTLITEIQHIFSGKLLRKNLLLNVQIQDEFPEKIIFSENVLRTILFNLVSNAIKFTQNGHIELTAEITYGLGNGIVDILFKVKDTGIGIDASSKELIFDAFYRMDNEINRKYNGFGLGLTLTKRLIDKIDGTINVQSQINEGSTFSVELKKVKVYKDLTLSNNFNDDYDTDTFENIRILVINSNLQSRKLIELYLKDFNSYIYFKNNKQEVFDHLSKNLCEIILVDLNHESIPDYDLIKMIKKSDIWKKIPIIAIANIYNKNDEDLILSTFDGLLKKPINRKELHRSLNLFLHNHKSFIIKKLDDYDVNAIVANNLVDSIDKQILSNFISEFDRTHKQKIREFIEVFDKDHIHNFISDFNSTAVKYGIDAFSDLSQRILNALDSCDCDTINESTHTILNSIAYCKHILLLENLQVELMEK